METLNNIKQIRWELGISTRKLAKMSGISHAHITKIENQMAIPSQVVMIKISAALNRDTCEVFNLQWRSKHMRRFLR